MDESFRVNEGIKVNEVARISGGLPYVKICTKCKQAKQMLGGTNKNKKFICKACKEE